jgi:hypothetical protein
MVGRKKAGVAVFAGGLDDVGAVKNGLDLEEQRKWKEWEYEGLLASVACYQACFQVRFLHGYIADIALTH